MRIRKEHHFNAKIRKLIKDGVIDHNAVTEKAVEEMGRFYATPESDNTVICPQLYFEKHGFICFSKLYYFDAFSRLELKVLCRLEIENRVVYAVKNEVNKFETIEITFLGNDRIGIKRGMLER